MSQRIKALEESLATVLLVREMPISPKRISVWIGVLEHEVFTVIFLDAQHRLIALKEMFRRRPTN